MRPDGVLGEEQALGDLADGQIAGQEREHGELGVAGQFEQIAARGAVARRFELLCHLVGERGYGSAVAELAERVPRGTERRLGIGQPPASQPDPGEEDEQPGAVQGRDLVGEEPLGRGELVSASVKVPSAASTTPRAADALAPSQLRLVPIRPTAALAFSAWPRAAASRPRLAATNASVE